MNCENYKKRIYLFDELNEKEKQDVEGHISTCKVCALVFEQFMGVRQMIKNIKPSHQTKLAVESRLTSRIMNLIQNEKEQHASIIEPFINFISLVSVRYGLTATSLFLLGLFAAEIQPDPTSQSNKPLVSMTPKIVTLDASIFSKHAKQMLNQGNIKEKSFGLYSCLLACKKSDEETCQHCLDNYSEKIKYYADL